MDWIQKQFVDAVKRFARANFEMDGWDYIVETMDDSDILELIGNAKTEKQAIRRAAQLAKKLDERRKDVQAEIF